MNRRGFLKNSSALISVPLLMGGQVVRAMGMQYESGRESQASRKLILIQLDGGNDGLNMIFPLDQYDLLASARPDIILPKDRILPLTQVTGIHPKMAELKQLFDSGKLMVIQNVGYPKPNLSHFRSKEIILSASESTEVISSGWLGRYLSGLYPTYPENYPNASEPHPFTISISNTSSPAFQGTIANMGIAIQSLTSSYQSPAGDTAFPDTPYGKELKYISQIMFGTEKYLQTVLNAGNAGKNQSVLYPSSGKNKLADQLKMVAKLISGGLNTPVYMVSLGGFDTHANQVDTSDRTTGNHASLLQKISEAINAFMDDMQLQGFDNQVIGMVYSEFGRRIRSTSSIGTDHGEAFPVILFGSPINPIVYGSNPVIPSNPVVSASVTFKNDFRSVYASILKYWYEVSDNGIRDVLAKDFPVIPILKSSVDAVYHPIPGTLQFDAIYPNPVTDQLTIELSTPGGTGRLDLYSPDGRLIRTLLNKKTGSDSFRLTVYRDGLPSGNYYLVLQNNSEKITKQVIFN